LRLWDAATGEPCKILPHPGIVRILAFGPDGQWLVSACDGDDRFRIWDVATARVRKEIRGPGTPIVSLAISPDGARVAASSWPEFKQNHLGVYDRASGERLFSAEACALAYSPDGRWLAVRDADEKTILLLDGQTYETVARYSGHVKTVRSAAFSHDSRRLASCSDDHTVRLWQVDPLTQPSPPSPGGEGKQDSLAPFGERVGGARSCTGTPARSSRRPSTPTVHAWPRPAATRRSGCGT
jgi:WD40 repeat protein